MSDEKCRQRVVARVVFTLNQLIQPSSASGMVEFITTAVLDSVEKEVPPPPRRRRRHGWCELAENFVSFRLLWRAREHARQFLRAHPRDRCAWKTLRSSCANLQEVIAAGLHAYSIAYLVGTERRLAKNDQRGFLCTWKVRWDWEVLKSGASRL